MSFVGTRPEATKYVEKYSNEMLATLLLPAGITSEASIRYKDEAELLDLADDVDRAYIEKVLPEKMKYNLQSIKNFCFVIDVHVMIKTLCAVLGKEKSHGILTSLKIMEVMMARKKKLSELAEGFTVYPQVLTNVRVTDKKAAQDDVDVQAAVKKVTEELGDTGRILVRESGTEPVVRVMVEAESEEVCQKYVDMVVGVIEEKGYVTG